MVSEIHLLPNKKVTLVLGHARWLVTSKAAPFKLLSSGIFSPVDFDNCSGEARDLKKKKKQIVSMLVIYIRYVLRLIR